VLQRKKLHRLETGATEKIMHRLETGATEKIMHRLETGATGKIMHRLETGVTEKIMHGLETGVTAWLLDTFQVIGMLTRPIRPGRVSMAPEKKQWFALVGNRCYRIY